MNRNTEITIIQRACMLVVFVFCTNACIADWDSDTNNPDIQKMIQIRDSLANTDVPLSFYGQILDQDRQPVQGASVTMTVYSFSPNIFNLFSGETTYHRTTDQDGIFTLQGKHGNSLEINEIKKSGYSLMHGQRLPYFDYVAEGGGMPFVPDEHAPVEILIHKEGVPTFCITKPWFEMEIEAGTLPHVCGYDFIRQWRLHDMTVTNVEYLPAFCDLEISGVYDTTTEKFAVTFTPGPDGGGILFTNQFLYEAPTNGYQASWSMTPQTRDKGVIYLKSRTPEIYTRIAYEIRNERGRFAIRGDAYTNPYGERSFEMAEDLAFEVKTLLRRQAINAFCHGTRPTPPTPEQLAQREGD